MMSCGNVACYWLSPVCVSVFVRFLLSCVLPSCAVCKLDQVVPLEEGNNCWSVDVV